MRSDVVLATSRPDTCVSLHDAFADAELIIWNVDGELTGVTNLDIERRAAEICKSAPGVVVLDAWLDPQVGLKVARACRVEIPDLAVVLLAPPTVTLLQAALRLGRCDVIDPTAELSELKEALARLELTVPAAPTVTTSKTVSLSRTVTVLAAKGGCGKTTVSVNLATSLATAHPGEVVLVDLDLQFGDCATVLGLAPERSTIDAIRALDRGETPKLCLTAHSSSLWLLAAPEHPALADELTAEHTSALLARLRADFRYVIVDTAAGMDEHTLAALEYAEELVVLTSTDVTAVRNARKTLEALDAIDAISQHRTLVVNRADPVSGVSVADVEAALGIEAVIVIPASTDIPWSTNAGVPVCLAKPSSPTALALTALARLVTGEQDQTSARPRRRWRR